MKTAQSGKQSNEQTIHNVHQSLVLAAVYPVNFSGITSGYVSIQWITKGKPTLGLLPTISLGQFFYSISFLFQNCSRLG